ncbi:MAG TPA: hypothetical protein PKA90_14820 [Ignavibacteria bacterium]|nr:hypothetical protein [Ignavibacteria bacterium]HMR41689.1 hypothetical protein [Ignavibacteria bacterium]
MKNLKLTELLLSLTPSELKRFGDLVRSPFYNKNKKQITLFEYIERNINSSDIKSLKKEDIFKAIYPGEKFNDSKLRSQLSDFKKLCEKFLIVTEYEKRPEDQKVYLQTSLSSRSAGKNFDAVSNEIGIGFGENYYKGFEHYLRMIGFEKAMILKKGTNVEVNLDKHYYKLSDAIDHYFLSSKLDLINSFLSRKYHVLGSFKLDLKFTDEIVKFIEANLNELKKTDPFIYCEYLIYKMMTDTESDKYFNVLQSYVIKNISKYDHASLEQVYFPMINFGFNKVALGEIEYLEKIFQIYRSFEKRGFYSDMEYIQDIDFISIGIAGLRLNKVQWTEDFSVKYESKLKSSYKESTVNLVHSLVCFKKKKYDEAISLLNKVNYENSYYYLKSRETLLQIYYEQKEFVALESLMDSVRHYLKRRREVLSIHYERYIMFMKFLGMLLKVAEEDKSKIHMLKKELKKNINVIGRDWLMEKVIELGIKN